MPTADPTPDRARYEALRDRAAERIDAGDLAAAEALFEQALAAAREIDDAELVDRAYCNLAGVVVESGRRTAVLSELRRILMSNRDPENCRLAAYHIARAYELAREFKKGLFYARIAHDLSLRLGRERWIASSHNRMGDLLLADSFFDEAFHEYEKGLELMAEEPTFARAVLLDGMGYCQFVRGDHRAGFRSAFASLRMMRRLGVRPWQRGPHLTLCFGYLEQGRFRSAIRHGAVALRLAEEAGDESYVKNSLYLLGEAANLSGDPDGALRHFETLQRRYYPDERFLANFLLAVDVRRMVNLKA